MDPDLDVVATSMGATQARNLICGYYRYSWPLIWALRPSSIRTRVVLGEFIVQERIRSAFAFRNERFGMSNAIALITILAGLALAFNAIIGLMERRFLKWQDTEARGKSCISLGS